MFSDKHVIRVFSYGACDLRANKNLILLDGMIVCKSIITEETEKDGLLVSFLRQGIDKFNCFLQSRNQVIGQKIVTVPEYLTYQLPSMDSVLHIVDEKVKVLKQELLVFLVISHKFQEENVGFFKNSEVGILVICLF